MLVAILPIRVACDSDVVDAVFDADFGKAALTGCVLAVESQNDTKSPYTNGNIKIYVASRHLLLQYCLASRTISCGPIIHNDARRPTSLQSNMTIPQPGVPTALYRQSLFLPFQLHNRMSVSRRRHSGAACCAARAMEWVFWCVQHDLCGRTDSGAAMPQRWNIPALPPPGKQLKCCPARSRDTPTTSYR